MPEPDHNSSGWQLAESGPEAYERYLVPGMFAPWAERLLDRVDPEPTDRVLDVGCGTGIVARRAASRVGEGGTVVGLDVNEDMFAVARSTGADHRSTVDWRRGDATDLPAADGTFDVVLCQQALQFVSDPVDALREIDRVLTRGGRSAVSVWRPLAFNPGYVELADALVRHVGEDAGETLRSPFPSWDRDDLRSLAREAEVDRPTITVEIGSMRYPSVDAFVRREVASSPLSAQLARVSPAVRDELVRDVGERLREYTDDAGVVFPMESFVLTSGVASAPSSDGSEH